MVAANVPADSRPLVFSIMSCCAEGASAPHSHKLHQCNARVEMYSES